jgi:hypothetical protein
LLGHLLRVVQKSDKNKMTVRNVSIVFSPTLGVPAGLFTLLLAEYSTIFSWAHNDKARGTEAESTAPVVAATENAISTIVEEQESKGLAKVPAHVPVIDVRNSESHSHQLHRPVTPDPHQFHKEEGRRGSNSRGTETDGRRGSHPESEHLHVRKGSFPTVEGRRGSHQNGHLYDTPQIVLETQTVDSTKPAVPTNDVQSKLAEVLNSDGLPSNFSHTHPNLPNPTDPSKRMSYNEYFLYNHSENDVIKALEKQLFSLANDGTYVPDSAKSGSPYMTDDIDANNILDDLAKELL